MGKMITIHFRWSVFQYLFLLSLKLQFLMMMLKYFTFCLYSRIAHIRLLLKFLFKILVVLRITSNLYVVKTMWLHFLLGQLHLFSFHRISHLWIAEFSGGSNFLFLCMYKFIHTCSLWKMITWDLYFLYSAWLLFFLTFRLFP